MPLVFVLLLHAGIGAAHATSQLCNIRVEELVHEQIRFFCRPVGRGVTS